MKPLDHVIIAAAGQGIRLLPYTRHIPKLLVNVGNTNLLTKLVTYWGHYAEQFSIIIDSKNHNAVDFYMKGLNVQYQILHADHITNEGTAYTLYHSLNNAYNGKKVLITWCDICPIKPINIDVNLNLIFTHGNQCRYLFKNNNLCNQGSNGNVVGIYYFHDYRAMKYIHTEQDICDVMNSTTFTEVPLDSVMDAGDLYKLKQLQIASDVEPYHTRYFNRIKEIDQGWLIKTSVCPQGDHLIDTEMKYYNMAKILNIECLPYTHSYNIDNFIMEKINGVELNHLNPDDFIDSLLLTVIDMHNVKHVPIDKETLMRDTEIEFYTKTHTRIHAIAPLIAHFPNITHVNGQMIKYNTDHIIDDLYQRIKNKIDSPYYHVIHGDIQFSNALMQDGKIKFIDPRGYYGKTFFFGHKYYDYSKILYALTGYDEFNNCPEFHINIDNGNFQYSVPCIDINKYRHVYEKHNIDWELSLYMMIMHWFGLTQYISNDILKSVTAYYIAIHLYHKYVIEDSSHNI
jgi:hypothetical protein